MRPACGRGGPVAAQRHPLRPPLSVKNHTLIDVMRVASVSERAGAPGPLACVPACLSVLSERRLRYFVLV